jgi:hypothetical protein
MQPYLLLDANSFSICSNSHRIASNRVFTSALLSFAFCKISSFAMTRHILPGVFSGIPHDKLQGWRASIFCDEGTDT